MRIDESEFTPQDIENAQIPQSADELVAETMVQPEATAMYIHRVAALHTGAEELARRGNSENSLTLANDIFTGCIRIGRYTLTPEEFAQLAGPAYRRIIDILDLYGLVQLTDDSITFTSESH